MIVLILLYATWLVQGLYKQWLREKDSRWLQIQMIDACLLASEAMSFPHAEGANYSIIKIYNTEEDKYAIT